MTQELPDDIQISPIHDEMRGNSHIFHDRGGQTACGGEWLTGPALPAQYGPGPEFDAARTDPAEERNLVNSSGGHLSRRYAAVRTVQLLAVKALGGTILGHSNSLSCC